MTSAKHHYTRADLIRAIRNLGICAGDTVSLQVSLGRLGLPEGASNYIDISRLVIGSFLDVLGASGTLIVPTYTYSIGRGELYEVETTPSAIGEFTEIFRNHPGAIRSRDPMLASAGIGPRAVEILRNISNSCYGAGSTFDRLRNASAKICTLGIGLHWATFRHHIEEMAGVPFRFRKMFTGCVREHGITAEEKWVYFAAPLIDNCAPDGLPLEKKARDAGLVHIAPVGRGEIMCVAAQEYFDFGLREFHQDGWLSAKGPALDVDELVRLENARVGCVPPDVSLPASATIAQLASMLMPLPRDVVSDGSDALLSAIATQIPLRIHEYASGTAIGEHVVPEKWTCRNAHLATTGGRRLFSYTDDCFHVPACSWPFNGRVSRDVLLAHLHRTPPECKEIPSFSLLGRRDWGLCCSGQQAATLAEDGYEVVIDSAFSFGTLKVGECIVQGRTARTILIIAQWFPRNDRYRGCGGVAIGTAAMKTVMASTKLEYTVRLLLVPGLWGLAAWVHANAAAASQVSAVIVLDTAGSGRPLTLEPAATLRSWIEADLSTSGGIGNPGGYPPDTPATATLAERCSELIGLLSSSKEIAAQ